MTLSRVMLVLIAVLLISYGLFEARRLIEGPVITITSPQSGSATSSALLTITGTAENISFLTVDGGPAFTDPSGHFRVTLSPPAGYTIVTVAARDRFGRQAQKSVDIEVLDYCPIS